MAEILGAVASTLTISASLLKGIEVVKGLLVAPAEVQELQVGEQFS
jgi:hypothetical protein